MLGKNKQVIELEPGEQCWNGRKTRRAPKGKSNRPTIGRRERASEWEPIENVDELTEALIDSGLRRHPVYGERIG